MTLNNTVQKVKEIPKAILSLIKSIWLTLSFVILLMITVFYLIFSAILAKPLDAESKIGKVMSKFIPPQTYSAIQNRFTKMHMFVASIFDRQSSTNISRVDLMEFSFKTILMKKNRSLVTMGGISFGVAFIVFLVSLGFGLQNVIISRAVQLNELSQTDVSPGLAEDLQLNDETISQFSGLPNVKSVYPVISSVGRIRYQESSFDVAVYGVTNNYLKESALQIDAGAIFESNSLSVAPLAQIEPLQNETVLGASDDGTLEIIELDSIDAPEEGMQVEVKLGGEESREIVVNRAFLEVMGVTQAQALDQNVTLQIVVVGELLEDSSTSIISVPQEYKIIGVIQDNSVPIAYVPFIDIRSLGVEKYSQVRITVNDADRLSQVRLAVESQGYATTSVADTVSQIENFFANLRIVLGAFGFVALGVASLGMFNTLTVSLLERTHEVGLLKALGMSSSEVRELFLSESMIMGFFGGVVGLILGMFSGKLLGFIMSSISVAQGGQPIDISYTPPYFVAVIIALSLTIGVITGWYPARRATKISALNALRYE